jgi:hypothetical protein
MLPRFHAESDFALLPFHVFTFRHFPASLLPRFHAESVFCATALPRFHNSALPGFLVPIRRWKILELLGFLGIGIIGWDSWDSWIVPPLISKIDLI